MTILAAMWAWLLSNLITPVVEAVLAYETPKIISWFVNLFKGADQQAADAKAVAEESAAAQSGNPDAIAKAGGDVLNGKDPNSTTGPSA